MKLGKAGWLPELLEAVVQSHAPDRVRRFDAPAELSARARARRWLRQAVRDSGLLFGTPRDMNLGASAASPEEQLFLAVVRTFAELALDVAVIAGAAERSRTHELLVLFAAFTGSWPEAEQVAKAVTQGTTAKLPRRAWATVEHALEQRAMSLAGDPAYGLVLHNGAVYVDALAFGRQALDYFSRGSFHRISAERRRSTAGKQKAVLVELLAALACAERQPSFPARRAILRQIEDLRLEAEVADAVRARVKKFFDKRPTPATFTRNVRSAEMRRFLLQQALLAARVDGRTSKEERSFLASLAKRLGFEDAELRRIEVEVAEFYAKNRQVVDVFTVSAAAGVMGEEVVDAMQTAVEKNFHRLMIEIRETGELSVLLARAARGQKLTRDEQQRMRAQLIDVAKAIPALAIFAAPGGVLLLIALAKVLPFSLLPSAFTQDEDGAAPEAEDAPAGAGEAEEAEREAEPKRAARR